MKYGKISHEQTIVFAFITISAFIHTFWLLYTIWSAMETLL